MLALLAQVAVATSWKLETTYQYVSQSDSSESQVYVFEDACSTEVDGTLKVRRVLKEHRVDSLLIPTSKDLEAETYRIVYKERELAREPEPIDVTAMRIWRATLLPRVEIRRWASAPNVPAATFEGKKGDRGEQVVFTFTESSGMSGSGTATLGKHGWAVEGQLDLRNAFLPGGDLSPQKLTVKWRELR